MNVWIYAQKSVEIRYIEYGHDILLKIGGLGCRKGRMTDSYWFVRRLCALFSFDRLRVHIFTSLH